MADRHGNTIPGGAKRFVADETYEVPEQLYHDEGDGTYSESVAAHMRVWDGANWIRWDGSVSGGGGGLSDSVDVTDRVGRLLGHVTIDNTSLAVTASSLPLPTGAAKDSTLTDGSLRVGGTVAVSGSLTDTELRASAVPVSAASLPLPSGAATDATLTDGTQRVGGTVAVTGTFWQATQPVSGPLTDTQLRASAVPVSLASIPNPPNLDAAASTLAKESGGNLDTIAAKDFATQTTLALIKAKTDNLDVALSTRTKPADSQHVTVDNASLAVTGTFWQSTQPVSIATMPSTPVTGPLTDTQLRATAVPVSAASVPSHDVTNAGTFAVQATLAAETTKVIGTVNQGTSPWVVSLPATAATSAKQDTGNVSLASIDTKLTSPLSVAQSGGWSTGRTWALASGTDSVAAAVSNFPATQAVTQSTSPWVAQDTTATAADATGALPALVDVIGGYDGTNVRVATVRPKDGVNMICVSDQQARNELEHLHVLMLEQNNLLRQLVGERADLI